MKILFRVNPRKRQLSKRRHPTDKRVAPTSIKRTENHINIVVYSLKKQSTRATFTTLYGSESATTHFKRDTKDSKQKKREHTRSSHIQQAIRPRFARVHEE